MALLSSILSGEFSIMNYLLLFIVGLLTYVATFYIRYFNRQNPLPGPLPIPIFGNALSNPGDPGVWVKQLRSVYGDVFEIYMGTKRIVVLCRGDLVGKLLFSPMRLSSPNEGLDELGVSKGGTLLNTDHDEWSYNRRFLHKTIATPNLAKEAVESTQVLFQEMESLWERLDKSQEIDLIGWFPRFTFDNIIFLTTTLKIHALVNYYNSINPKNKVVPPEGTLPNSEDYVKSIETYFESAAFFALAPKVVRNLPGIRNMTKMFKDNKNWLVSSVLGVVKSRRDQIENSKEDLNTNDLLTQLLTINTEKDVTHNIADNKHTEKMSDNDVVANITDPIGGGTLTVANTLCFIIYHLAHHPNVQERMVKELDSVLGNDRNSHITFNQMDKLVYTDAVIKEVMRIYPTMPLNLRSNLHPNDVPGYTFPVNTQFIIGTEEIHNSSDWTDPDEFYPDRWLDNTFDIKQRKDSYFQFGAGVRICPGRYLGLAEIKTLLALLYRKYDIELVDKVSPLQYNFKLIKACKELKVKIKLRIED